jgi:hypothetical protein
MNLGAHLQRLTLGYITELLYVLTQCERLDRL